MTEMVPELIWTPDFLVPKKFGPREIWAPRNLVPEKFGPQEIWSFRNLGPTKVGSCIKMLYNYLHAGTKFLRAQTS